MSSWLETYKPVASSRFQLWLAGAMWTTVGVGLTSVGGYWLMKTGGDKLVIFTLLAVLLGIVKSFLVLERAAHRFANRIQLRGEGKCVGGFLSVKGWALVVGMMLLGRVLRSAGISYTVLGLIYLGVGVGMVTSSRIFWLTWFNHSRVEGGTGEN